MRLLIENRDQSANFVSARIKVASTKTMSCLKCGLMLMILDQGSSSETIV